LALFGILALLAWFTIGDGSVLVMGKPVEIRAGSADCDWRAGIANGFSPAGGEDSERQLVAFSYSF
jgi:hypothetical protein